MTNQAASEATQTEFPVVPVPEHPYTGATAMEFAEAFRAQYQKMFLAGVEQEDAFELAHMYALAVAEEHMLTLAHIRGDTHGRT
jgi:hypothetical protein